MKAFKFSSVKGCDDVDEDGKTRHTTAGGAGKADGVDGAGGGAGADGAGAGSRGASS